MKKTTFILAILILTAMKIHAQIPNSGFEQWWTVGNCQIPTDYFTYNLNSGGSFFPISRDTSHYPPSIGAASIRLENKASLLPANESKGIIVSSLQLVTMPSFQLPSFQVTGHPNSLTGYYKYAPQNGDTMWIALVLFQSGVIVSQGAFYSSVATPGWTSFNIPVSAYATADSAEIIISAYNADQPAKVPLGNSVLNIDNLNFDNLIFGIKEEEENNYLIYPNPTSGQFTISLPTDNASICIRDIFGLEILKTQVTRKTTNLNIDNNGIYIVYVTTTHGTAKQKLLVNR